MAESQILYGLFGPKNQSLRNKFCKMQPIRTKFGIHGHVKGWQRSGNFGRDRPILGKMGAGTSSAEREFYLCGKPRDLSATSQRHTCSKLYTVMYEVSYNGRGWTSYVSNCRSLFDWKDCSARQLSFLFGLATAKKTVWICHRVRCTVYKVLATEVIAR